MSRINKQGIEILTWDDVLYPPRLKEIDQPPPVLYLRGTLKSEDTWAVAVVGTRRVSAYGRQVAEEIGSFLAANGVTVVSGLARGVDAIAHQSALESRWTDYRSAWLRSGSHLSSRTYPLGGEDNGKRCDPE